MRVESSFMNEVGSKKRGHAVALFSGGLDSALAILLILQQNIEVTALTFMTHFGCDLGDRRRNSAASKSSTASGSSKGTEEG